MTTKTIVIGSVKSAPKSIEFERILESTLNVTPSCSEPSDYKFIELIVKDYAQGYDLMFAYDDPENRTAASALFLGQWNDGIVEE